MKILVGVWVGLSFSLFVAGILIVIFSVLWRDAADAVLKFLLPFLNLDSESSPTQSQHAVEPWLKVSDDIPRDQLPPRLPPFHPRLLVPAYTLTTAESAGGIYLGIGCVHPERKCNYNF